MNTETVSLNRWERWKPQGAKDLWGNKEFLKGIRVLAKLETKLYRSLHHATVIWTALLNKMLKLNCKTQMELSSQTE